MTVMCTEHTVLYYIINPNSESLGTLENFISWPVPA